MTNRPREARFWDKIADKYAKKPVPDEAVYQEKLAITREFLNPETDVLEFGCGTGSTALAHAPFVRHIDAIDVSERMIEIAREKATEAGIETVAFQQGDINGFEAGEGAYDAVLGLSILHLVADREAVIGKVHRMLKPGGVFVSSTACLGDGLSVFKMIGPIGHTLGILPLLRVFTADELADSLLRAGFTVERFWRPGDGRTAFIVARKPDASAR